MLVKTIDRNLIANIHLDRIVYVESMGNQCTFNLKDGKQIVCYISLKQIKERMPDLVRVSGSVLINELELRSVRKLGAYAYMKMSNGEKLKIPKSSGYLKDFLNSDYCD